MNVAERLDAAFVARGSVFAHRGTCVLSDSNGVSGAAELATELAAADSTATIGGSSGGFLSDGQRSPSGLSVTIGGDSYTASAAAIVQDGRLALPITPAATTTYASGSAVVLGDSVTWDLVALEAQVESARDRRHPGSAREGTNHSATVYVLKSKLPTLDRQTIQEMELTVDGESLPVKDVVDEDPHFALIGGGAS